MRPFIIAFPPLICHLPSLPCCSPPLNSYESVRFPDEDNEEDVSGRFSIGHSNPHRLPTSEMLSIGYRPNLHALLMDTYPLPPPPASPVPSQGGSSGKGFGPVSMGDGSAPVSARDAGDSGSVGRNMGQGPYVAPPPSIKLPPVPREAIKHAVSSPLPNPLRRVTISGGGPVPTVAELVALRGSEIPATATPKALPQSSRGSVPNLTVINAAAASSAASDPSLRPGASAAAAAEKGFFLRTSHRSSGGGGIPACGVPPIRGDSGIVSGSTLADDRDEDVRGALSFNVTLASRPGNSGPIPTAGRLVAPEHEINRAVRLIYRRGSAGLRIVGSQGAKSGSEIS